MNCNQSLIFTVNFCAQKCRIDLDTVWRFVYIACFTNDSLLEPNRNSTRWCLSHWYRCIWFPYERYRRLGRRRFRLCHGLWWFHILKGARCLLMQTEREKERKEQTSKQRRNKSTDLMHHTQETEIIHNINEHLERKRGTIYMQMLSFFPFLFDSVKCPMTDAISLSQPRQFEKLWHCPRPILVCTATFTSEILNAHRYRCNPVDFSWDAFSNGINYANKQPILLLDQFVCPVRWMTFMMFEVIMF